MLTCTALALALASATGGETFTLAPASDCPAMTIARTYPAPVTIIAKGSTISGLTIKGGNIIWKGGTLKAPAGLAVGPSGYGVLLRGARKVWLSGVTVTDAKKGIVLDGASEIVIADSSFVKVGEDGIIVNNSSALKIIRNSFRETVGKPTSCLTDSGTLYNVPERDCPGLWIDGYHADAIQMRNGVTDAHIASNRIEGPTQGITQMDTTGDKPLTRVRVQWNTIITNARHRITLGECVGCVIENNVVRREEGSIMKAVIIPGSARVCGNIVQDQKVADVGC